MESLLDVAHRHATNGERIVNQLELIVIEMRREGQDSAMAEELLDASRALLVEMREDVERHERGVTRQWRTKG